MFLFDKEQNTFTASGQSTMDGAGGVRMLRVVWVSFLVCMAIVGVLGLALQTMSHATMLPNWLHTADQPAAAWLAAGMFLGGALSLSVGADNGVLNWEWTPPKVLIGLILFSATLGAAAHQVSVLRAGIASALAILAVITGYAAYDALQRGDPLGIQSSWGGLGGGLGGWQLSRSAGLVLITLAAIAGAVMSLR
jgi:hypothetical protein